VYIHLTDKLKRRIIIGCIFFAAFAVGIVFAWANGYVKNVIG
jgi:hypothetical protein